MAELTRDQIVGAEAVAGVRYTDAEREQMLATIETQIAAAVRRRRSPFPNDLPMASRFDPRLPGFQPPRQPAPGPWALPDPGPLPQNDADIAFAPLWRLSGWFRTGALTSARLTGLYLDRIATVAPRLECFITVTADLARAEAEAADRLMAAGVWLGPLHGMPYGLKDLFDTAGLPTTWGAAPYRDRVAEGDAAVARRLRTAGAVLLGKTTLGALAYGDIWFGGRTRNPWNPAEGSSGSSAGSASATAAGLCAFSIGTETLGSITSPSQRCGTTGLRPTFGRVSRAGAMTLCWSLDKTGPICRATEDCALVLAAINGGDAADRGSIDMPFGFDPEADPAGMVLGWNPAAFEKASAAERAALDAARGLGLELREISLPDLPWDALLAVLHAESAAAFEELTLNDRDDEMVWQDAAAWPNSFRQARFLSAVDHVQADRLRYRAMQAMDTLFGEVDAMIGPYGGDMLTVTNFTGHPCLHIRAGFDEMPTRPGPPNLSKAIKQAESEPEPDGQRHKVPVGLSLWAGLFDEPRLLTLGRALETALGVAQERPPIAG